jgi:hypothetical protein
MKYLQLKWDDESDWKTLSSIALCRLDEDVLKSARALLEEFDDKNLTYAFNASFRIVEAP